MSKSIWNPENQEFEGGESLLENCEALQLRESNGEFFESEEFQNNALERELKKLFDVEKRIPTREEILRHPHYCGNTVNIHEEAAKLRKAYRDSHDKGGKLVIENKILDVGPTFHKPIALTLESPFEDIRSECERIAESYTRQTQVKQAKAWWRFW